MYIITKMIRFNYCFYKKKCVRVILTQIGGLFAFGICARIEKVVLPGMVFIEKFSIRNRKKFDKKTKTNTDFFDDDDDREMIYSEDECHNQLIIEVADQVEAVIGDKLNKLNLLLKYRLEEDDSLEIKRLYLLTMSFQLKYRGKKKVFAVAVRKSDRLVKK